MVILGSSSVIQIPEALFISTNSFARVQLGVYTNLNKSQLKESERSWERGNMKQIK